MIKSFVLKFIEGKVQIKRGKVCVYGSKFLDNITLTQQTNEHNSLEPGPVFGPSQPSFPPELFHLHHQGLMRWRVHQVAQLVLAQALAL